MVLIDTHTLIWTLSNSEKLSDVAKNTLNNESDVFVSVISLWEIALKQSIGKLELSYSISDIVKKCEDYGIKILAIKPEHLDFLKDLPFIHRDPFDRLLISQAAIENLSLISKDENIAKYSEVKVIW